MTIHCDENHVGNHAGDTSGDHAEGQPTRAADHGENKSNPFFFRQCIGGGQPEDHPDPICPVEF